MMKKISNKYRNANSNNSAYSLNYKFDSMSSAGKISGTALELIKKYNELAKEAHSNGNYTEMENFRQYAEHYRKIVTDINEKKNNFKQQETTPATENANNAEPEKAADDKCESSVQSEETIEKKAKRSAKQFKVIEISEEKQENEAEKKTKRRIIKKSKTESSELAEDKCANS